jgi:hypothetical protein
MPTATSMPKASNKVHELGSGASTVHVAMSCGHTPSRTTMVASSATNMAMPPQTGTAPSWAFRMVGMSIKPIRGAILHSAATSAAESRKASASGMLPNDMGRPLHRAAARVRSAKAIAARLPAAQAR